MLGAPDQNAGGLIPYRVNSAGLKEPVIFVEPKRASLVGRCFTCGKGVVHGRNEVNPECGYGRRAPHCCDYGYRLLLPPDWSVDGWATRDEILADRRGPVEHSEACR